MDVRAQLASMLDGLAVSVGGIILLLAGGLAILAMWRLIALVAILEIRRK